MHMLLRNSVAAGSLLLLSASLARPQTASPALITRTGTLEISGAVKQPVSLKPEALRAMPRTTVTVEEKGETLRYEGVLVGELLKRAGAAVGDDMRGPALQTYVIAS